MPHAISYLFSAFIRLGGMIDYIVEGTRHYSSDLLQGGIEIPCKLVFKGMLESGSFNIIINKQKSVARKHSRMTQIS